MKRLSLLIMMLALPQAVVAAWLEASSANFVVYADDSEKNLRKVSEQLELYHHALEFVTSFDAPEPSPSNRVIVYIVSSERQVQRLYGEGGSNVGGFYIPRAGGSVAIVPRVRARSGEVDSAMLALLHEYAHHFVTSNSTGVIPAWVDEGSAEFFASADFPRDGGIRLGKPAEHRAAELYYELTVPVAKLFNPDAYQDGVHNGSDSFYGTSWALYHYLSLGSPARKGQLPRYLELMSSGKDWREAGLEAFGDFDQLDKEVANYLKNRKLFAYHLKADMLQAGPTVVRALTPGHAAMMPIIIQSRRGVDRKEAKDLVPQARKVAAAHPADAAVLAALAEAEFDAGEDANAIAAADAALALDPQMTHAYLQKGYALVHMSTLVEDSDRAAAVRNAVAPFLALNKIENDHPLPLIYYYLSFLQRDATPSEQAVRGLARAVEIAPFDVALRMLHTRQLITTGDIEGARANLQRLASRAHATELARIARTVLRRIDAGGEFREGELLALLDGEEDAEAATETAAAE